MKNKSGLLYLLVLAGFAALVFYLTFGGENQTNDVYQNEDAGIPELSQEPYLTSMRDLEGNERDMDKNKVIFLNVWATWCGPCIMEMPGIQSLYQRYKSNDRVSFYIVSDEDAATISPFIARREWDLPFYTYTNRFPGVLDGQSIPRTYIIYKGRILAQHVGAANWDTPEIHELIDQALQES